jgi:hypothetical protein
MGEKLHWFALSFDFKDGLQQGNACTYMGYPEQLVTVPRINRAKQAAGIPSGASAVLIGLSYMGLMTKTEVETLA